MDHIDSQGFRANVGIIISNPDGALLLAGRAGQDGWQFPQGGIRKNESLQDAMYRELNEEVGLTPGDVRILGQTTDWLRYRLPSRYIRRNSKPLCVGQKQRWFLLQLTAPDTSLRLDTADEPEFDRWRWVNYWDPVQEVIYFKRAVYVRALHELGPILFPQGLPPRPAWWSPDWNTQST